MSGWPFCRVLQQAALFEKGYPDFLVIVVSPGKDFLKASFGSSPCFFSHVKPDEHEPRSREGNNCSTGAPFVNNHLFFLVM